MRRLPILLLAPALLACTPQNADITAGTYTAFFATNTSGTLFEGQVDFDKAEETWAVDCVNPADDRLDGALEIVCGESAWSHEVWVLKDSYRVVQEPLEPWRGEAVVTSEGDLQLAFHQRLPGGADFRFAFVVDPDFEPQQCVETDGGTTAEPVDGGNWVEAWTGDRGGSVFYLNAGGYQFNPSDTEDLWILPQEWLAGFAAGKIGEEQLTARRVRYGLPAAYTAFDLEEALAVPRSALFYAGVPEGTDPTQSSTYQGLIEEVETVADEVAAQLEEVGVDYLRPDVHGNEWRAPDGFAAGLDNWVELHYTWVHFDQPREDLVVGEPASGEFYLTFDAAESASRVFLHGEFEIDRIKRDRWVTDDVQQVKLEEAGTVLCAGG